MNMQSQCAKSFQCFETLDAINPENQLKLMDGCIKIILGSDILQEEVTSTIIILYIL